MAQSLSAAWQTAREDSPDPIDVLRLLARRPRVLEHAWTQLVPDDYPPVIIANVVGHSNPFIVRSRDLETLIVMCEGLSAFVFGAVLTAMLFAHDEAPAEDCLPGLRQFAASWLTDQPARLPPAETIQRLSVLNQETTTFAVGLANSAFTWAFYHEVGHFKLGHMSTSAAYKRASANGAVVVSVDAYAHSEEFAADAFGLDRYLDLLSFESRLRQDFEIGRQADHAAQIFLRLIDLAYRTDPAHDHRLSVSHPQPLDRALRLDSHGAARFSNEGRDFYSYFQDLMAHTAQALNV